MTVDERSNIECATSNSSPSSNDGLPFQSNKVHNNVQSNFTKYANDDDDDGASDQSGEIYDKSELIAPNLTTVNCMDSNVERHDSVNPANQVSVQAVANKNCQSVWLLTICNLKSYRVVCDTSQLCSPVGILRILLLCFSFVSLLCIVGCSSSQQSNYTLLPSSDRLQFHVFMCTFSLIVTFILLIMEMTNFIQFLYKIPLNWPLFETITKGILCLLLIISTSLVLHLQLEYGTKYRWVSSVTRGLLLASVVFGFLSVFCSFILAIISWYGQEEYKMFREESKHSGNEYLVT
ncbi:Uncharacterised protein g10234 [Pycnogonum litorale]